MDATQTLAFAGLALAIGEGLRRALPLLMRLNLPGAVLGGLAVAVGCLVAPTLGLAPPAFDTSAQKPLLVAFFATLGFSASVPLLRAGGRQVVVFLALATAVAILQGVLGMGIAALFGLTPLFGVLTGTATLAGGPATALAFAPAFEQAGVSGAAAVGIVAAMGGIVLGGLVGGPLAGRLIGKPSRASSLPHEHPKSRASSLPPMHPETRAGSLPQDSSLCGSDLGRDSSGPGALSAAVLLLLVMWGGGFISAALTAAGLTLPAYVGAMLAAALLRNAADALGRPLPLAMLETLGNLALPLFMAMALMTLDLRQLAGLASPLLVNLAAQTLLVMAVAWWFVPRLMGRDYDAAVMAGGFTGFMLGTTANAMAVMGTLVHRYGPAPRAYLVAPLVGAFFIDFTNAIVITAFLNWNWSA